MIYHRQVVVHDLMQQDFIYKLTEKEGENFHPDFQPDLSPKDLLHLGVFGGKYMTDCQNEFPKSWFDHQKLCHEFHDPKLNYFEVNASQPLSVWRAKGWIYEDDPRGWFQWYCRYFMGRRIPHEDMRQIKRWQVMIRHIVQVKRNCNSLDLSCRRVQRQALLHWAYDSRKI